MDSRALYPRAAALTLLALLAVLGLPDARTVEENGLDLPPALRISVEDADALGWPAVLRHAAEAPVTAVVPGSPPPVFLEPPRRVRAGRTAALRVRADEPVRVTLDRPEGTRDTIALDAGGSAAFLLRPLSGGWRTWSVQVEAASGTVRRTEWSALVEPARPLRILAISGPPGPESDLALRALEEAGEEVEAWIHLGRDVWVGRSGGPLPDDAAAFSEVDVIVLFPGITLEPPQALALLDAVRARGKGLLLAATDGGEAGLRATMTSLFGSTDGPGTTSVRGDSLRWLLPPEVPPLPPASLSATAWAGGIGPGGASDASLLRTAEPGRGRLAVLALSDTWRWRMGAGATDEHRAFWQGVVSWLTDGFPEDPALEVLGAGHRAGDPVRIRRLEAGFRDAEGPPGPPWITVSGPVGTDSVRAAPLPATPAGETSIAAFVPAAPGAYFLRNEATAMRAPDTGAPDADTVGADIAGADPRGAETDDRVPPTLGVPVLGPAAPDLDPHGRLARIAVASPGGSVLLSETEGTGDAARAAGPPPPWHAALFAALALLLGGAWLRRRLSARA